MIKIIGVLILTILVTGILLVSSAHALPSTGFYPFRRVYEKLVLVSKNSPEKKVEYYRYLLQEREKEVRYAYTHDLSKGRLSSSLRYSTTIGEVTNLIISKKLTKAAPPLITDLDKQKKDISLLRARYKADDKKHLDDALNYIDFYASQLKQHI